MNPDNPLARLCAATGALLAYIDEAYVFDKLGDAGCGGVDPYRSDKFDALIEATKEALQAAEKACK